MSGQSLDPLPGSLFEKAQLSKLIEIDSRIDIRDAIATRSALVNAQPDVVIHLAAQSLVRESYANPRDTFATNVMGTLNVLDAIANTESVQASLIITTDKVYRNTNTGSRYCEDDPLGGDDPYSASKAMADLLTQSWVKSFPNSPVAIARAGNVIGGGDISTDRLMPDLISAFQQGKTAMLRFPNAVRPWQHVLDCLNGYQLLVSQLLDGKGLGAWNFGPTQESELQVSEIANIAVEFWGEGASWVTDNTVHPYEAELLALNSDKARRTLNWNDKLDTRSSVELTIRWSKNQGNGMPEREACKEQIKFFSSL